MGRSESKENTMGRYYNGDIEGKFWFGIQSSSAADRFGVTGSQPEILEYYFDEENLETIEKELSTILESLNGFKDKLDEFFENNQSYTYEELSKYLNVSELTARKLLVDYADYGLGEKILKCIKEYGSCAFDAELC